VKRCFPDPSVGHVAVLLEKLRGGTVDSVRCDGRKRVRNVVLVAYTVKCASRVARAIASEEEDVHVVRVPAAMTRVRDPAMLALCRHPSVGAVWAVAPGCDYTQPARIAEVTRGIGRPAERSYIQESGGALEYRTQESYGAAAR
jgi:altronate hydrolase